MGNRRTAARAAMVIGAAVAVATGAGPALAGAAPGTIDLGYGTAGTGLVTLDPPRNALVGAKGDVIVLAGQQARRLTAGGRLDTKFGTRGTATLPGLPLADIRSVRLPSGGAVYAAASSGVFPPEAIVVTRLRADGSPDTSLGGDGSIDYPPTSFAFNEIRTSAVTGSLRTFIGGNTDQGPATIRRIEADGSLTGGGVCTGVPDVQTFPGDRIEASAAVGERVVVAGFGLDLTTFASGLRVRVLDGCGRTVSAPLVTLPAGTFATPQWILRRSNGWLVAGGDFLLAVDELGNPDASFGAAGFARWSALGVGNVQAGAVDARGRVVLWTSSGSASPAIVRLTAVGTLDTAFGTRAAAPIVLPAGESSSFGWIGVDGVDVVTVSATFRPDFTQSGSASRYRG